MFRYERENKQTLGIRVLLITLCHGLLQTDGECSGYAFAIAGIGTVAVAHMALLDEEFGIAHGACRIVKEEFLLLEWHETE